MKQAYENAGAGRSAAVAAAHAVQVWIGVRGGVGSSIGACSGEGTSSGGGSFSGLGGGMSGSGVVWARHTGTGTADIVAGIIMSSSSTVRQNTF